MDNKVKKFLFLYSELAGYMLSCMKLLTELKPVEIEVICWPVNKEAPFSFIFPDKIKVHQKSEFTFDGLVKKVESINPDVIYCSGWIDKDYTKICKRYKSKIPVITAFDNKWKGSIRQYIATLVSPFTIKKYFSHCFVPGPQQYTYAQKLGFQKGKILTGLYVADIDFFSKQYALNKKQKEVNFPKRFIYVGRYYSFKGLEDLWNAFTLLQLEHPSEWELWCFGTGDLPQFQHPKVKHFGFVQTTDMDRYIAQTGVFVLPSRVEPWAVVVQEYAAAGYPLILSSEVGAASVFLENKKNGFLFNKQNVQELKSALHKMIQLSDFERSQMAEYSASLAHTITPKDWVTKIYSVLETN